MGRLEPLIPLLKTKISDVTLERELDVYYENTTGRPLLALISLDCLRENADEMAEAIFCVATPDWDVFAVGEAGLGATGPPFEAFCMMFCPVPPGYSYCVESMTTGLSVVSVLTWIEVEL